MTPAEILKAAKDRIATPERWCRGACAEDAEGNAADPVVPGACRWCAAGAVLAVEDFSPVVDLLHKAVEPLGYDCVGKYNDDPSTTHADILTLFDRAIANAESQAAIASS